MLEEAGIKWSVVRSSVMGLSRRAIPEELCTGESDPVGLAQQMHRSRHATQEQVVAALTGEVCEHHRFPLRELLALIEARDHAIKHLEQQIEQQLHPIEEHLLRCELIKGVVQHILHVLMAELGADMKCFPGGRYGMIYVSSISMDRPPSKGKG
jgi:transposase